jgi:hypothetical protein
MLEKRAQTVANSARQEAAAVRGYKGKNGRHGRRAAKEAGRPPGDYDGRMGAAARRARVSLGARWLAAAVAGAACLTVLVPLGSLAGRTECRSRYSRRAPHELCAYPSTPARQTVRHRASLLLACRTNTKSAPLSAPRAASDGANLSPSLLALQLRV